MGKDPLSGDGVLQKGGEQLQYNDNITQMNATARSGLPLIVATSARAVDGRGVGGASVTVGVYGAQRLGRVWSVLCYITISCVWDACYMYTVTIWPPYMASIWSPHMRGTDLVRS
jgi:hypothetical protein